MWPFKKKKPKKEINSLYKKGEFVRFPFHGEVTTGYIWEIKEDSEGKVIYDIQVPAQCPWFAEGIPEEKVKKEKVKTW